MAGSLFVIAPEGMATEGFYRMTISFVSSRTFVNPLLEIAQHVIACAHGERDDGHRGGLVGAVRKDARVTDVEVGHVVGLGPLVGHVSSWGHCQTGRLPFRAGWFPDDSGSSSGAPQLATPSL